MNISHKAARAFFGAGFCYSPGKKRSISFMADMLEVICRALFGGHNLSAKRGRALLPVGAALLLGWASLVPWLREPVGPAVLPWQMALRLGWRSPLPGPSYGLVCMGLACCTLCFSFARLFPALWRLLTFLCLPTLPYKGLCYLAPPLLFSGQLLFCDMSTLTILAYQKRQSLLMQKLFFYSSADQLIPLQPFALHSSTLWGRVQLLFDQADYGLFLPLLACLLLLWWEKTEHRTTLFAFSLSLRRRVFIPLCVFCLLLLALMRGGIGIVAEEQARSFLATGAYAQALSALNIAQRFLPSLADTASYHLEEGEALYYLSPSHVSPESQAYLAAVYRTQRAFSDAFQLDYALWQASPARGWIAEELGETLEAWIDSQHVLKPTTTLIPPQGLTVLPRLQLLERVDAANVYSWYLEGRIEYLLQNYAASQLAFSHVLRMARDPALLSSTYTYLAFNEIASGRIASGRHLLFVALTLDPAYRNNTAREALSGLH